MSDQAELTAKMAALMAINERQTEDIGEIKGILGSFLDNCRVRHENLSDRIASIESRQAHCEGVQTAGKELSKAAYAKFGVIATGAYAVIVLFQWLLTGGSK